MSEKLGFVFGLFLFMVVILPFGVNVWYINLQSDHFYSLTNEIQKLMNQEGGASENVLSRTSALEGKGFNVQFLDKNSNEVVGIKNPGETIHIQYHYQFKNIYGKKVVLDATNSVLIQKRRSVLKE